MKMLLKLPQNPDIRVALVLVLLTVGLTGCERDLEVGDSAGELAQLVVEQPVAPDELRSFLTPARSCSEDGWCWMRPGAEGIPGHTLHAITARGPDDIWAVGDRGLIVHDDGHDLTLFELGAGSSDWGDLLFTDDGVYLERRRGSCNQSWYRATHLGLVLVELGEEHASNLVQLPSGALFALGQERAWLSKDHEHWRSVLVPWDITGLETIHVEGERTWVRASCGTLFELEDDGSFTLIEEDEEAHGIAHVVGHHEGEVRYEIDSRDVFEVTFGPDGEEASREKLLDLVSGPWWLTDVAVVGQQVHVVAGGGVWMTFDREQRTWTQRLGTWNRSLTSLSGRGTNSAIATGWQGGIHLFDGESWTHELAPESDLRSYSVGHTADATWLFESGTHALRRTGSTWEEVATPDDVTLAMTDGDGRSLLAGCGLYELDPVTDAVVPVDIDPSLTPLPHVNGCAPWVKDMARGPGSELFVVVERYEWGGHFVFELLHFDGQAWSKRAFPEGSDRLRLSFDSERVWAIDPAGRVFRDADGEFQLVDSQPVIPPGATGGLPTLGLVARTPSDVWVFGREGLLQRFDGKAWSSEDPGTSNDIYAVWPTAEHVTLVGEDGLLMMKSP